MSDWFDSNGFSAGDAYPPGGNIGPGTPPSVGGPPTGGNLRDPTYARQLVAYYASQPGANPSLARDPDYWIQKITSGELGADVNYIVGKFMTPEGAPAGGQGGFSPDDPSYQWRLGQGLDALAKSASAKGTLRTGGAQKDILNYAQGLASTEYGNQFQRQYSLADLGLRGTIAGGGAGGYGTGPGQVYLPPGGNIGPGTTPTSGPANATTSSFGPSAFLDPTKRFTLGRI